MNAMAYTAKEEAWNSGTHAAGILFATAALAVLATLASVYGDAWSIVSCSIFGASMLLAYSASSAYHYAKGERAKRILKKFDHISIYYLIAGSYTPFMLVSMRGSTGWTVFGIVWALAIVGAVVVIAGIAYAVYRYLTPDYLEDFEDDFDDDFDDYFEDEEE